MICGECEHWRAGRCMLGSPLILDDDSEACLKARLRERSRCFNVEFWNSENKVLARRISAGSKRQALLKIWKRVRHDFEVHSKHGDLIKNEVKEVFYA
jgi:hypothetical protein